MTITTAATLVTNLALQRVRRYSASQIVRKSRSHSDESAGGKAAVAGFDLMTQLQT